MSRPPLLLLAVGVAVAAAGCSVLSLFRPDINCSDDDACPADQPRCIVGVCRGVDALEGDVGEGEFVGEGEGEFVGEGEGEFVGEGEGEFVGEGEGEGEFVVGEGEGEGEFVVGEGEGEGEGEPVVCDFTVTLAGDTGGDCGTDCTLRQTLGFVQNGPGTKVVCLATDVVVSSRINFSNGAVVIVGNGHTVTAPPLQRLFDVRDSDFTLRDLSLTGSGTNNQGGAAVFARNTALTLDHVVVHDFDINPGFSSGGAVFAQNTTDVVVHASVFRAITTSTTANGGALTLDNGSTLVVDDTLFEGNRAKNGAALYIDGDINLGNVVVERVAFVDNVASDDGAAIEVVCSGTGALVVENASFVLNAAGDANGGGAVLHSCGHAIELSHTSWANNASALVNLDGNAVTWRDNAMVADRLCIGAGASVSEGGNVALVGANGLCTLSAGVDLSADPLFTAFGAHGGPTPDLALNEGSPARGAAVLMRCPSVDQRGRARVLCDAGATEN